MSTPIEVQLALGRIFRLMSRPAQDGDVEQYEAARRVVLDHTDNVVADYSPNYARDHNRGAAGG
jgi:hypothetical protein